MGKEKNKRLVIHLPEVQHRRFKAMAAARGLQFSDLLQELIRAYDPGDGQRVVFTHALSEELISKLEKQEGKDIWSIVDPYAEQMVIALHDLLKREG
jgi:PhoPQ-activated pathogenicity-related protein